MLFDKLNINLGSISPGTQTVFFKYLGDIKIKSISKSCGCTSVENKNNTLEAVINYRDLKRNYTKNINITVTLEDNTVHVLKVQANVQINK